MEKLLAMSILSSTPAEVSGGPSWMMMNASPFKNGGDKSSNSQEAKLGLPSSQSKKADADKKQQQQQQQKTKGPSRAWFALEFDGLNCFETIVSH